MDVAALGTAIEAVDARCAPHARLARRAVRFAAAEQLVAELARSIELHQRRCDEHLGIEFAHDRGVRLLLAFAQVAEQREDAAKPRRVAGFERGIERLAQRLLVGVEEWQAEIAVEGQVDRVGHRDNTEIERQRVGDLHAVVGCGAARGNERHRLGVF